MKDIDAIPEPTSKREWQKKRGIDPSTQVKIVKLSHMRYQHPDLNKITTFLRGQSSLPGDRPPPVRPFSSLPNLGPIFLPET